jgi:uncharacterized protein YbbC (DUF1343 family)
MKLSPKFILPVCLLISTLSACAGPKPAERPAISPAANPAANLSVNKATRDKDTIQTGAEQTGKYLKFLKGKKVGMVVNPTSVIGNTTVVDSLLKLGVNIVKIFGPEHGFRGDASNGTAVSDAVDQKTGIKAISLYGKHEKPTAEDLAGVDVIVFDIQDVGVRFYTYINTLQYVMQACAEQNKKMVILDRPNPNGFYVDGPILDPKFVSGIGLKPIPIVHGLTVGEYAQMLNGEGWLNNKVKCEINIIRVANYDHDMPYVLPVKPSPNLNTPESILLYPTLCLFEGTFISQGRGTMMPFTVLGAPALKGKYTFTFTPRSIKGMSETPLHQDQVCYGIDFRNYDFSNIRKDKTLNIKWLIELYQAYPDKTDFFNQKLSKQMGNLDRLAGVASLKQQIIAGIPEQEIRASWEPGLSQYKEMRKKYLLYP